MRRAALLVGLLLGGAPARAAQVPFVGCPADGQLGPQAPPRERRTPDLPPAVAARLAYYAMADGPAVLAPRGWHCAGSYGSNGASLIVTPHPVDGRTAGSGPAVQLSLSSGATSGRFEAAAVAARLFPAARGFVDAVEAEGILDGRLVRRPYTADRITHRGPWRALYTTPANARGLGTAETALRPGPLPVDGIAILQPDGDHDLTLLAARLPPALRPLVAYILKDVGASA